MLLYVLVLAIIGSMYAFYLMKKLTIRVDSLEKHLKYDTLNQEDVAHVVAEQISKMRPPQTKPPQPTQPIQPIQPTQPTQPNQLRQANKPPPPAATQLPSAKPPTTMPPQIIRRLPDEVPQVALSKNAKPEEKDDIKTEDENGSFDISEISESTDQSVQSVVPTTPQESLDELDESSSKSSKTRITRKKKN